MGNLFNEFDSLFYLVAMGASSLGATARWVLLSSFHMGKYDSSELRKLGGNFILGLIINTFFIVYHVGNDLLSIPEQIVVCGAVGFAAGELALALRGIIVRRAERHIGGEERYDIEDRCDE